MNDFKTVHIDYLRPSRTIETVLVSKGKRECVFYVYNYEGISFRVFENQLKLYGFLNSSNIRENLSFQSDLELDEFLSTVSLD